MDFHSLTRRELQTLCKKNKIPANMTNVAMADALAALTNVEGIEEIEIGRVASGSETSEPVPNTPYTSGRTSTRRRNAKDTVIPIEGDRPSRSRTRRIIQDDEQEVKDNKDDMSEIASDPMPPSPKTGLRLSTRRRPVRNQKAFGEDNPESSKPATRTQCRTRKTKQEDEQEDEDPNNLVDNPSGEAIHKTPATRNCRRRATGNSVLKAKQDENEKQDLVVSQVCSTRRSARLQSKASETDRKTGRRTESVQIAALSEEESEELSEKLTSVVEEINRVSGDNAMAEDRISAEKGSCNPDIQDLQEDSTRKDASTAAFSDALSNSIASDIVTDLANDQQMDPQKIGCSNLEQQNLEKSNAIEEDLISGSASEIVVSSEIFDCVASLDTENFIVERTLNPEGSESDADYSMAVEKYLVEEEDASALEGSTENDTHKSAEQVTESSGTVEFTNSLEEPLNLDLGHIEDLDLLLSQPFDGYQSDNAQSAALPYNEQNIVAANIDKSSGLSKYIVQENEEFDNDGKEASIDAATQVESAGKSEGDKGDNIGLQVAVKEGLHAEATGETPLPEIWDFVQMKDSVQECLSGMEEENSISESAPLDIKVTGEMESVDEKSGKNSYHLDFYSTDNLGLLHCPQSIEEPSYEKMVVSDMELENFGSTGIDDCNSDGTARTLSSNAMAIEESSENTDAEFSHGTKFIGGNNVHESNPTLRSFVVLSDVVSLSSTTASIPNQVPSYLSPCKGLASESEKSLNQFNATPTRSSMKKKSTPSQRKATIMVLDENIDGKYSGGASLRKKSNSMAMISAAEEKENYSGGLCFGKKSNSKALASAGEENENKGTLSGRLSLRNKSNSKVITSVAEDKENNKFEDSIQRALKDTSLRQLKKLFKEKLMVVESNVEKQSEKTRAALQTLTDNSLMGSRED